MATSVLVVVADADRAAVVASTMALLGHTAVVLPDPETAMGAFDADIHGLVILDLGLADALVTLGKIRALAPMAAIVAIRPAGMREVGVEALKMGADSTVMQAGLAETLRERTIRALNRRAMDLRLERLTHDIGQHLARIKP